MLDGRHKRTLNQMATEWRELESRIKACEQIQAQVNIASINELRYAGRRIVAALSNIADNDGKLFNANLRMAESYFHNAQHDLTDALVGYYNVQFRQMENRFGPKVLHEEEVFLSLQATLGEAMPLIRQSRKHMQGPRFDIYNALIAVADELVEQHPNFKAMNLRLDRQRKATRTFNFWSVTIGLLGLIAGVVGLVI